MQVGQAYDPAQRVLGGEGRLGGPTNREIRPD